MTKIFMVLIFTAFFSLSVFAQSATDYKTLLSNCLSAVKNGQYTQSIEFCSSALQEKKDSGTAYYLRAFSYSKVPSFSTIKSPTGEKVTINLENRKQFAVADAEKCLQFISNEFPCYSLIGTVLYGSDKKDELEKAVKNLNEAIRLGDKNIDLYLYRGIANFSLAKKFKPTDENGKNYADQAIAEFTNLMQLNPKDDQHYIRRSRVYEFLGKYNLAIADLTKFLESNKVDEQAIFARGKLYLANRQYQLAIDDFTEALTIAEESDELDFYELQEEILPLRMKAFKALKKKAEFCEDLKVFDAKANCDNEWKNN